MKKKIATVASREKVRQALRYSQLVIKQQRIQLTDDETKELASLLKTLNMSHEEILRRVRSGLTED